MSYGWLSESTLPLKKPKPINVPDESNEPLRQIINEHLANSKSTSKKKKNLNKPELNDPYVLGKNIREDKTKNQKPDSNKGVEERDKKDRETKQEQNYNKILAKKAEIYEKLRINKLMQNLEILVI